MLDIRFIRESPKVIKESQKKRGLDEKDVDLVISLDEKWRSLKQEVDSLRAERNRISERINEAKKQGKKIEDIIKKAKLIPEEIRAKEGEMLKADEQKKAILESMPNIVDKSVPVGDASHNKVIETHGKPTKHKFPSKGHEELLLALDQLDMERAAKATGARFYYLKGDIARMNYAIISFALDHLRKKGFTVMQPPYMLKKEALKGAIPLSAFEEMKI